MPLEIEEVRVTTGGSEEDQRKTLEALLCPSELETYPNTIDRLCRARDTFHHILAAQFSAPLNAYLSEQNLATLADKRNVAQVMNRDCQRLGLAISCPKTHVPVTVRANTSGPSGAGRFQLFAVGERASCPTLSSTTLPDISLIPLECSSQLCSRDSGGWSGSVASQPPTRRER